jgi:hypothetical protein
MKRGKKATPALTAKQCLTRDGASNQAIRARVALIAAERGLPEAAKVLRGRLKTWELVRFSE